MSDKISKYQELYDLIGLELTPDDFIVPNSKSHIVYLNDMEPSTPYVAVSITGSQWDLLWWINRLSGDDEKKWEIFVTEFVAHMYFMMRNGMREFPD